MNRDCTPVDPLNNVLYLSNMSEAILPFIPTSDSGPQSSISGSLTVSIPADDGNHETNIERFKPFDRCLCLAMYGNCQILEANQTAMNVMTSIPQVLLITNSGVQMSGYATVSSFNGVAMCIRRYFHIQLTSTVINIRIETSMYDDIQPVFYQLIFFK